VSGTRPAAALGERAGGGGGAVRSTARVLALTTLQQAGLTAVRFGLPILVPFWRDALHLSLARVGLLLGAFDLGALVTFIPIGLLTDRWGEPAVLALGALFTAVMTAGITQAHGFWSLALLLAVAGLGYGSGQTAGTKAVAAAFGAAGRGTAMGVRQSGLPLGGLVAALLLPPLAERSGWRVAVAAVAAVCALPGVLCWLGLREDRPAAPAGAPGPRPLRARLRGLVRDTGIRRTTGTAMLLVVAQFCYQGYLALYMVDRFGWSKHVAAGLLVAVHLGGVLGRLSWGALSDRVLAGRRVPALAWCAGTGTVFPLVLIALPHPVGAAAAAAAALAGGALLLGWNGLYSTLITEAAGPGRAATAMGVSMTLLYTATVVAPPLFGWLVDHSSYAAGWAILTGVMVWATLAARRIPEPAGLAAPGP
jgi:MFS family permease